MVFVDGGLNSVAADFASDTFFLGFSTDTAFSASSGDTSLSGEVGSRISCSVSRSSNEVTITGTRSGTSVVDTVNGDTLYGFGVFDSAVGGTLFVSGDLPAILHTVNYDLDFDEVVLFDRG